MSPPFVQSSFSPRACSMENPIRDPREDFSVVPDRFDGASRPVMIET